MALSRIVRMINMIEILTSILVIITGFYAWVTFKILKANEAVLAEMRNEQEALYRPYISITPTFYPENPCFFLSIKNVGKTEAKNLSLTMDKDFYKFGKKSDGNNIKDLCAFSKPIVSFAPGAEILIYLAQHFVVFGNDADENITPKSFTVSVQYQFGRKSVSECTLIDLKPYIETALPQDPIVKKLKEINESINKKTS